MNFILVAFLVIWIIKLGCLYFNLLTETMVNEDAGFLNRGVQSEGMAMRISTYSAHRSV